MTSTSCSSRISRQLRTSAEQSLKQTEKAFAELRSEGGLNFAAAAGNLIRARLAMAELGQPIDLDATAKLAEEAYKVAPSMESASVLSDVLLCRLERAVAAKSPEYARMSQRCRHIFTTDDRLLLWLERADAPTRQSVVESADYRRLREVAADRLSQLPEAGSLQSWVLVKLAEPTAAEPYAESARENLPRQQLTEILYHTSSASPSLAADAYWRGLLAGKPMAEAEQPLVELGTRGLPLPMTLTEKK